MARPQVGEDGEALIEALGPDAVVALFAKRSEVGIRRKAEPGAEDKAPSGKAI